MPQLPALYTQRRMRDFNLFPRDIVRSSAVLDNEVHYSRGCMCKRRRLKHVSDFVYVYYRVCVCGKYRNRRGPFEHTAENRLLPTGHIIIDGVDIHANAHCHYVYLTEEHFGEEILVFQLKCHCNKNRKQRERISMYVNIDCNFSYSHFNESFRAINSTNRKPFSNREDMQA